MIITFYPASGAEGIVFEHSGIGYGLREIHGIERNSVDTRTRKSPGQRGETLHDSLVGVRTITMTVILMSRTYDEFWEMRQRLTDAMAINPTRPGESPEYAVMFIDREVPDLPIVFIECVPIDSPQFTDGNIDWGYADVELRCSDPDFKGAQDNQVILGKILGFEFLPNNPPATATVQFPLEMFAGNTRQEVINAGNVDTPMYGVIYGFVRNPTVRNLDTGEQIVIVGTVLEGDRMEFSTSFGEKYMTYISATTGSRPALNMVDVVNSTFFSLHPGLNRLTLDSADLTSGYVSIIWQSRWSGI